ncbi:uncharacterized protein LOC111083618 [Limulus polyphemus]|uniref:Uncharacterized protein LOC111083618 n=1 Tax=Limulus polyphemus TaxID=6850 RepID=A0ABM1RX50_LIMPO|nr:uncharacterized protein LOC111083618 [Limulus polyphemus]
MMGQSLNQLRKSASRFVRNVADGTFLSIVTFANTARVALPLTRKMSGNVKEIQDKIPVDAIGSTAIGDGLKMGLKVVGNITDGARFLLISDGDENIPCQGPCIDDIWQDLQNSGVIIDTVALGVEASSRLEEMSSKTGGNSHYIPCDPQRTTEQFDKPFFYFSQKIKSDLDQPEVMLPNVERLVGGDWESFDVLIDSSIGRNTRFIFITSMVEDLEVELSSPELKHFGLSDSHWHISPEEMIVFDFPNAEAGLWRVNLRFRKGSDRVLTVVRSEPRNFTSQIISVDTWTENDIRDNQDVVVIKAKVSTNKEPLEGVAVDALVTTPNGERMKLEMIETEGKNLCIQQFFKTVLSNYVILVSNNIKTICKNLNNKRKIIFFRGFTFS